MHGRSKGARKKARIEIVPLIDIMFFLLACFMLVSLSMVNAKSVKVSLPTAQTGTPENKASTLAISVTSSGAIFLDRQPVGRNELQSRLAAERKQHANTRVVISGDADSRHGSMVAVLDSVRAAGIENIAFQVQPADSASR